MRERKSFPRRESGADSGPTIPRQGTGIDLARPRLDDPALPSAGDPGDMLGAVASAGEQIRTGLADVAALDLRRLAAGRPRALVVAGMGGSAAAGDLLVALAAGSAPFPVLVHRDYGLPSWVGREDLVIAVSCSGTTAETLSSAATALARGARLLTVGAARSVLSAVGGGAEHLDVSSGGRQPRACLWSLATPVLALGAAAGAIALPLANLVEAADELDSLALRCAPGVPMGSNPAKALAAALADHLIAVWGFSPLAAAAAGRFANQLAENAKLPAIVGAMPEPHHNQVVAFDGPFASGPGPRLHPVLVRDPGEDPRLAHRATETARLAAEAGLRAVEVLATGRSPIARLASLIGVLDFTSVYLALAAGVDPTPVEPITRLKARLAAGNEG